MFTLFRERRAKKIETQGVFKSFFMGGFECSSHLRHSTLERLDLLAATMHDEYAVKDFKALQRMGISTVRDGIRWHLIEKQPFHYDFSMELPRIRIAHKLSMQVIWDVCHYGWPEDLNPFDPEFAVRLSSFAAAFVSLLKREGTDSPFVTPINEISFLAWMGGTQGHFPPFAHERGDELKTCFVRASIECIHSVKQAAPDARICAVDPLINVVGRSNDRDSRARAEHYRQCQYAAWDMLTGRSAPELGGRPELIDIVGINYYIHNQWRLGPPGDPCPMLAPHEEGYRPLSALLQEVYHRYRLPLFISETGIEGARRARWLRHIMKETRIAMRCGVPIKGVCLYPITDYPGWADDRMCHCGLLGHVDENGDRPVCESLSSELIRQQRRMGTVMRRTRLARLPS